jgi:hypothetical protein
MHTKISWENLKERETCKFGKIRTGFTWLKIVAGFCENGDEYSGFINGRKFIDYLSHYQLLKYNCSMEIVELVNRPGASSQR